MFPDEFAGSSDRAGLSISTEAPVDYRILIAASEDELGSGGEDFGCASSVRKSGIARVRSRADCYAFPDRCERRAALEDSSFF